jgi:prolyl-tRNA editing enzyme YbaK/EbsC (Cys-tRNA(Pro) deacylase)
MSEENILEKAAVGRVQRALEANALAGEIKVLKESARTAKDAAAALGVEVGQIASSLVFALPNGSPLLVITSGRHRVDTEFVAQQLNISHLERGDANWVKDVSGFSVGGVAPIGWQSKDLSIQVVILIDKALADYKIIWAAAGHPHAVFPTSFSELLLVTGARVINVSGEDK